MTLSLGGLKVKNNLIIDESKLMRAIRENYGLEITDLQFLLRGWGGDCYRADTLAGTPWVLKVFDPIAHQNSVASSRAFYLPLMHELHDRGILPNIPHPLPTQEGDFSLKIGSNELVITNFINGNVVGFGKLPDPIVAQLAGLVGTLHNCRAQLEFEQPFIDQFEISFEHVLLQSFEILAALDENATPGQLLLRQTVLPRQTEIVTALQELKKLQAVARESTKPKVICHTDLHGANLMTDAEGRLYILDWENALIAPPEHDLIFYAGESNFWEVFWPPYERQFPAAGIDPQMLSFYLYRRALEDIADFILRILRVPDRFERDQEDIQWMLECLNGIENIETTISGLTN